MKLKSILYILMLLPFLWSCNNEDDVEEIFASGTWHVVDFYGCLLYTSPSPRDCS